MSDSVVLALAHQFPTYAHGPAGMQRAPGGDYVHELHAQALAERVILAQVALRQGRTQQASDILAEAYAYLSRRTHTR